MARQAYVLTLTSGTATTNATVANNSSLRGGPSGQFLRFLYQDPSDRLGEVNFVTDRKPELSRFEYPDSEHEARFPPVAEPNTQIEGYPFSVAHGLVSDCLLLTN